MIKNIIRRIVHSVMIDVINENRKNLERLLFVAMGPDAIMPKINIVEGASSEWYNYNFYKAQQYSSFISAMHVLIPIFQNLQPNSVIDFGCGVGTWLRVAKQMGVKRIYGIDGEYVDRQMLLINDDEFHPQNLEEPIVLEERFDIAISCEVGEHLRREAAGTFVESICNVSDVVIFSAAHPGQGGENHINCQPMSYWEDKFLRHGYVRIDIREQIKNNREIEKWYRDNLSIYASRNIAESVICKLKKR